MNRRQVLVSAKTLGPRRLEIFMPQLFCPRIKTEPGMGRYSKYFLFLPIGYEWGERGEDREEAGDVHLASEARAGRSGGDRGRQRPTTWFAATRISVHVGSCLF